MNVIPLGRVGNAQEIAKATAFLLGEESGWMTGNIVQLDGGIGNLKNLRQHGKSHTILV